jgi:hypothetical protein
MNAARLAPLLILCVGVAFAAPEPDKKSVKEGLQVFQDLVGSWRATGTPNGSREEKERGFWQETISWEWQFKGDDAWLKAAFAKGKYFATAELRYIPADDRYRLTAVTPAKQQLVFEGARKDNKLTLERTDDATKERQRLIINLLHSNRYLYSFETCPGGKTRYTALYQVGATKEGVPFASEQDQPECVVSGGLGTSKVTYKGKTYYVCCSGCRTAFQEEPEKYIKEFEERKAKKK